MAPISSGRTVVENSRVGRNVSIALLIIGNSLFAGWDIVIRELYALSPHPFHPILFNCFRAFFSGLVNAAISMYVHGMNITLHKPGQFKFDDSRYLESMLKTRTRRVLGILFASACGIFAAQIGYLYGVKFTSATHGAVLQPLVSVLAMTIAVTCGAEKLGVGVEAKKKIYGLVFCVCGAFVVVLGSGHHEKHAASATGAGTTLVPKDAAAKSYPIAGTSLLLFEVIGVALYFVVLPILTRFYNGAWLTTILLFASVPMFLAFFFLLIEIDP